MTEHKQAKAYPTKSFFVDMITRDITLEDSILDLIDNSVDGAWRSAGGMPISLEDRVNLSPYHISLEISADRFSIKDNCGGMSLDDAINHAFNFGRFASRRHDSYGIGVYGIGMKRAAFKLARNIHVKSTFFDQRDLKNSFSVPIDVNEWLNDDDVPWSFRILDVDAADNLDETGVEFIADQLTSSTKNSFENPAFVQNLKRTIARDYAIYLSRGLVIEINNKPIKGAMLEFKYNAEFCPARIQYEDSMGNDRVHVEVIGGMAAPPPESIDPDETEDGDKRYGWYVICNGRVVLAADKTTISGWGAHWPQWHRQYSGFIGVLMFTAENAASLPLTTTKRSVDVSSEIFHRARKDMRDISRMWINYTNARKQTLDQAREKEKNFEIVALEKVKKEASIKLPELLTRSRTKLANVHYSVPVDKIKKLAKEFGKITMPYREVGIKSFEHTYVDYVGEE